MAVIENTCALLLEADGGAKRVPWRQGPQVLQPALPDVVVGQPRVSSPALPPRSRSRSPEVPAADPGAVGLKRKAHPESDSGCESDGDGDQWRFTQELHARLYYEVAARRERERVMAWKAERVRVSERRAREEWAAAAAAAAAGGRHGTAA